MGEPASDSQQPSATESRAAARVLLDHAARGWAAEEERARLIQRQQQLAVAVLLAATGAFFSAAVALLPERGSVAFWLALLSLGVALASAASSFSSLIQGRRSNGQDRPGRRLAPGTSSSSLLNLDAGNETLGLDVEDERSSLEFCLRRTEDAQLDLQWRNDQRVRDIRYGSGNLVIALGFAFLGVLILVLTPEPTPALPLERVRDLGEHHDHPRLELHQHFFNGSRPGVADTRAAAGEAPASGTRAVPPAAGEDP